MIYVNYRHTFFSLKSLKGKRNLIFCHINRHFIVFVIYDETIDSISNLNIEMYFYWINFTRVMVRLTWFTAICKLGIRQVTILKLHILIRAKSLRFNIFYAKDFYRRIMINLHPWMVKKFTCQLMCGGK